MKFGFVPATLAHIAANTHADAAKLPFLSVEGDFLFFNFGEDATHEGALESLMHLRAVIGEILFTTEDQVDASGLTALLAEIDRAEMEVNRAFASIYNATADVEATVAQQETRLQGETHAAINESPSSNEADSNSEELITNGEENESNRTRRKR